MSNTHYVKAVDVEEWAALCGKFKQEREDAKQSLGFAIEEINMLKTAIRETLDINRHLADGDDCTLIQLKRAIAAWDY